MPIIEVEGQRFEFPDGTSDEVIGQSIRTFFGDQQAPEAPQQRPIQQQVAPIQQPAQQGVQQDATGADINGITSDIPSTPQQQVEQGVTPQSVLEPAATLVTGAIAEPVAGIAGIAQAINPFAEPGAGARAVEATREALTFQPKSEEGQRGLQAVSEFLEPVADVIQSSEKFLGDETFKATDSPALAAAATTIPTVILEALGLASGKGIVKAGSKIKQAAKERQVAKAIVSAAPDIEQLKDTSRAVYKELDDSGVQLQPKAFRGMVNRINLVRFE